MKKVTQAGPEFTERPRYQLLEKAFLSGIKIIKGPRTEAEDDVFLDPESMPMDDETDERRPIIIEYDAIPGPHMKPLNDAAKDMVQKHLHQATTPINSAINQLSVAPAPAK